MPTHFCVGCAYVFVGAWSYLVTISAPTFLFLWLDGCHLPAATFLLTTNTNKTMKRALLLILTLCVTMAIFAQEKVTTYYSTYFGKECNVEATIASSGELSVFFDILGSSDSDNVCINIKGENINAFISALQLAKQKHSEWVAVAINNNVTKMTKEMDIDFPRVTIGWLGSKWWFDFAHKIEPLFMITDSGKYLCVISGTATASSNEYIDQKYYLVFETAEDFDSLMRAINPAVVQEKLNSKQKVEDLFQ